MDTKLKNRHKLAIFFIMITILIPSLAMMTGYFSWYQMRTETKTKALKNAEKSSDFLGHFLESTYLLYNTESGRKYADDIEKSLYDSYNAEMSEYSHFNSYLDYRVLDENGGDVEKVIDIYAEHGQGRERLGNYIDRIGLEEFKKQLNIEEFLNA